MNKYIKMPLIIGVMLLNYNVYAEDCVKPEGDKPYVFKDGKVDDDTAHGYQVFQNNCMRCHGQGGVGSTFAPDLTDSLTRIDKVKFIQIVAAGKQDNIAGIWYIMPAWGGNAEVMKDVDSIYAYLKARSDKVIPDTKPESLGVKMCK